jgi:DNA-binding CsgD family transcriptional regulator
MKRFDDALKYMSKSDSICHAAGLEIGQLINQVNRAELYLDKNENQLALAEIDGLQNVISNYKNPDIEISLHELLNRIYDALGNENMANLHYRKYKDKREQFIGNIPSNLIAEWELSLEREKALELQRSFEVKTESRNRTFYFLLFIFTLVISVLIVILFFINRRSLKIKNKLILAQQKNAHDVELKSKELIAESIKNVTIKTVKEGIYKEVKLILNKLPEENRKHFSKFLIDIKSSGEDVVLEEFDKRFIGVYDNFYEQLQQRAIDLTPIELRVCALIRLNCSTKEIALLMNRSIGRIENIRISIRKKLGLSKDENLQQFLLRI